jgi:tripartite-type tricarboxylate transporter receptor subunit TctC
MDGGTALVAPANLPKDIAATLSDLFRKSLALPDVRVRFEAMQQAPFGIDPEGAARILRDESARWKKLIAERNIQIAP